jgi:hypothetical protein
MYEQIYNSTIFFTQGGGLARQTKDGTFVFVETPNYDPSIEVGDPVPCEWGIQSTAKTLGEILAERDRLSSIA